MTEAPQVPAATNRNPAPRPALQRRADDDAVISARPRAGAAPATTGTLALPDPAAAAEDTETAEAHKAKAKAKVKAGREERAGKDGKKPKDGGKSKRGKHHKAGKGEPTATGHTMREDEEKALTVVLPKAVRRALTDAAVAHGTTPERLAALVLNEWLDH